MPLLDILPNEFVLLRMNCVGHSSVVIKEPTHLGYCRELAHSSLRVDEDETFFIINVKTKEIAEMIFKKFSERTGVEPVTK